MGWDEGQFARASWPFIQDIVAVLNEEEEKKKKLNKKAKQKR